MVVSSLQKGLINSCIVPRTMVNYENIFFSNANKYVFFFFLVILIEIFILKTHYTHVSQVYIYITKIQKKKLKNATIVHALHFGQNIGGIFAQSLCYYLSFVFPPNLIWLLLHCNAIHFDSFSLGARHLFQKLVLFFLYEVILVMFFSY
jgi:hypothetical protein